MEPQWVFIAHIVYVNRHRWEHTRRGPVDLFVWMLPLGVLQMGKVQLVDDVVLNGRGVYKWFMDVRKNPFEALLEALYICHWDPSSLSIHPK